MTEEQKKKLTTIVKKQYASTYNQAIDHAIEVVENNSLGVDPPTIAQIISELEKLKSK